MVWFKKKNDVVDLTDMQRRGLLSKSSGGENSSNIIRANEGGVVDLSSYGRPSSNDSVPKISSTTSSNDSVGGFGFLSNLAGASSSDETSKSSSGEESESYVEKLKLARKSKLAEFNHMKVKLEDVEYKMERFIERIEKIEERLDSLLNCG